MPGVGHTASALVLCIALHLFAPVSAHAGAETEKRPNILIVITDDESWLERGAYGWTNTPTPNFDKLAKSGVLFNHGYSSAPSCAPARASLLTGRHFWELEQGAFIQAWLPKKFPVVDAILRDAGYHTGSIGKLWGPGVRNAGSHGHEIVHDPENNRIKRKPPAPALNRTDYAANFDRFLERKPDGKPFHCWVGITEPHDPHDKNNYKRLEKEYGIKLEDISMPGFLVDTIPNRRIRANFLYEVIDADKQLGLIIDVLEKRGELENTLVLSTSDNGTAFEGIKRGKAFGYDWGVHVPLAISWPGKIPGGRTVDDFVSFPDLTSTILEAAQCTVPGGMTDNSILGTLRSEKQGLVDPERDFVVTGVEWHGELAPVSHAARMVRDKRYELVVTYGNIPGEEIEPGEPLPLSDYETSRRKMGTTAMLKNFPNHSEIKAIFEVVTQDVAPKELYDLKKDPWQLHNLIDDPSHADVAKRLEEQLITTQKKLNDPRAPGGNMSVFDETRKFVENRKKSGYKK